MLGRDSCERFLIQTASLSDGIPNASSCLGNFKIGLACIAQGKIPSATSAKTQMGMAVYQARKGNIIPVQFMDFCFREFLFQFCPGAHFLNVFPFNQDSCL